MWFMGCNLKTNIHITEIQEGQRKGTKSLFKAIMTENYPLWERNGHPDSWDPQRLQMGWTWVKLH